jgi:CheY-specific phosphatase CheX
MSNEQITDVLVREACISLFEDYGLPLTPADETNLAEQDGLLYCGVLGFSGDQLRGSMLLATSREPLDRTNPTQDGSFREWMAELANQLLGRVKNKLLRRNVAIFLSTPVVLRGQHLAPLPRAELLPMAFTCAGGMVCVWFDAEFAKGVVLSEMAETDDAMSEGASMMF